MPIAVPNNDYLLGIDKQTNESTVGNVADYSLPVYSGRPMPDYDERRVQVTDAASIQGDISKGLSFWSAEGEFPAFGDSLGRWLQAMWVTDTMTGAGPFTHTYSGLGGTQPWVTLYDLRSSAGTFYQRFAKGLVTSLGFTFSNDETPVRIRYQAFGQEVLVGTSWTATLADDLTDGYFTLFHASATVEEDPDTPNVNPSSAVTNFRNISLQVERNAGPAPTIDGVNVRYIAQGLVAPSGTGEMIWSTWDEYRASYFGAVAGTTLSSTVVTGALDINAKHTLQASWNLELYVPAVQIRAMAPEPSPDGDVLVLPVTFNIQKPSSGSHIQPILVNGTNSAY